MRTLLLATAVLLSTVLAACGGAAQPTSPTAPAEAASPPAAGQMALTTTAFEPGGEIPQRYGQVPFRVQVGSAYFVCNAQEGVQQNVSPALSWSNVPSGARSLALLMVDKRNAPGMPVDQAFVHWSVYNMPPSAAGLAEGVPAGATLPDGSLQGLNSYPEPYNLGYGGPCPGPQTHLYVFILYAVDARLELGPGAEAKALLSALQGHVLAQVELAGTFTGR